MGKKYKQICRKVCAWLLIAAMAAGLPFTGQQVYADTPSENTAVCTHISSSSIQVPQSWTLDIKGSKILARLTDTRTDASLNAMMMLLEKDETNYNKYLSRTSSKLEQNSCTMSLDLSLLSDGVYKLLLWEKMTNSSYSGILGFYLVEITGDVIHFADAPCAQAEEEFLQNVNDNYDPKEYSGIPYPYYSEVNNMDEIIQKAEELTESCSTIDQKLTAIQDYLGREYAFDSQTSSNLLNSDSRNPEWVFRNKRGNCVGFSQLFQIMAASQNIPCILVGGYASSSCLSGSPGNYMSMNHEWPLVYVDSSWRIADITWNNQNEYIGKDAEENRSGNLGNYGYTGIAPANFGYTHHSVRVYAYAGVEKLAFEKEPVSKEFYQEDLFVFDGTVCMLDQRGEKHAVDSSDRNLKLTGADLSKTGKQTVTLTYFDKSLDYEITVRAANGQGAKITKLVFAAEPQKTVFQKGDPFTFDGSVCYVNADNETHPISADNEKLEITGYNMNRVGKQTVTVSYEGFQIEYEITVNEPEDVGIYLEGEDIAVKPSEEFELPVRIVNNPGIMGIGVEVTYDPLAMTPISVVGGELLTDGTLNDSIETAKNGTFKILWSNTENITGDGTLLILRFKANQNIKADEYNIRLKTSAADTFDEDFKELDIKGRAMIVTIKSLEEEALKEAKEDAKRSVDEMADVFAYDEIQRPKLLAVMDQAKEEIDLAKTEQEIAKILERVKKEIEAIPQKAEGGEDSEVYFKDVEVKAKPSEEIEIPVRIVNNPGIMGIGLKVTYDASVMTPIEIVKGEVFAKGTLDNSIENAENGSFKVFWSGTENVSTNGSLFTIRFKLNTEAKPGKYKVEIINSSEDSFNEEFDEVEIKTGMAAVTVEQDTSKLTKAKEEAKTEMDGLADSFEYDEGQKEKLQELINTAKAEVDLAESVDEISQIIEKLREEIEKLPKTSGEPEDETVSVTADNTTAKPSEEFSLPIRIVNNKGIMGMGLVFTYDAEVMQPLAVTKGEVFAKGTLNDSIGTSDEGTFRVMWSNTDSVSANGILFTVKFDVKDGAKPGTYTVKIANIEEDTFDESFDEIEIRCRDASVTIKEEGSEEELEQLKEDAKKELDGLADADEYDDVQKQKLKELLDNAKEQIDNATDEEEIADLLASAREAIGKLPKTSGGSEEEDPSVYKYELNENGTITITACSAKVANLVIPDEIDGYTVTGIGELAFADQTSIRTIQFPKKLKVIGSKAFSGCSALSKVVLPDSIEELYPYIFLNCTAMKSAIINNGRINIVEGLFYGCTSLTDVTIPGTVNYIREFAFGNCKSLTNLIIPTSLRAISENAFTGTAIKTIAYAGNKTQWSNISIASMGNAGILAAMVTASDGSRFSANSAAWVATDTTPQKAASIKVGTRVKTANAYYVVTYSGKTVEVQVTGLINKKAKTFTSPDYIRVNNVVCEVTGISNGAFRNCKKLSRVTLGTKIKVIGSNAFKGCKKLKKIQILSKQLKKVGKNALKGIHSNATIRVPGSVKKAYQKLLKKKGQAATVKIK